MTRVKVENKRNVIDMRSIAVTSGQTLKIETSPNGEEILVKVCPEGETWTVTMHIVISITD